MNTVNGPLFETKQTKLGNGLAPPPSARQKLNVLLRDVFRIHQYAFCKRGDVYRLVVFHETTILLHSSLHAPLRVETDG